MAYIDKHKIMRRIETEALRWGEEYDLSQIMGDIEDFPEADVWKWLDVRIVFGLFLNILN